MFTMFGGPIPRFRVSRSSRFDCSLDDPGLSVDVGDQRVGGVANVLRQKSRSLLERAPPTQRHDFGVLRFSALKPVGEYQLHAGMPLGVTQQ